MKNLIDSSRNWKCITILCKNSKEKGPSLINTDNCSELEEISKVSEHRGHR